MMNIAIRRKTSKSKRGIMTIDEEQHIFHELKSLKENAIKTITSLPKETLDFTSMLVSSSKKDNLALLSCKKITKDHYLCKALRKGYERMRLSYNACQNGIRLEHTLEHHHRVLSYVIYRYNPRINIVKKFIKDRDKNLYHQIYQSIVQLEQEIIMKNIGLVNSCIAHFNIYQKRTFSPEEVKKELLQEGIEGLYRAISLYDVNYGTKFSTFAVPHIKERIQSFLKDKDDKKICYSLNEIVYDEDSSEKIEFVPFVDDFEKQYDKKLIEEELIKIIGPSKAQLLLDLLGKTHTESIKKTYGYTRKKLERIIKDICEEIQEKSPELLEDITKFYL